MVYSIKHYLTDLAPLRLYLIQLEVTPFYDDDRSLGFADSGSSRCIGDEKYFKMDLTTDSYGFETSWALTSVNGELIQKGPPANKNYASNSRYYGGLCLSPGIYRFNIFDKFKDGMCCNYGEGKYEVYIDGLKRFSSPSGNRNWAKRGHSFTIFGSDKATPMPTRNPTRKPTRKPTRNPTMAPTSSPSKQPTYFEGKRALCNSSQRNIKIEVLTDKYGEDTSWFLTDSQGNPLITSTKVYGPNEKDVREICLEDGTTYEFILRDTFGDGMCCTNGQGYFKVLLEEGKTWKEILSGGAFKQKEIKQVINLKERVMTDRDKEWLESHNIRRKAWHEGNGKTYVPLKWSAALKAESKVWAEKLLDSCGKGMYHDPDNIYGENVAGNSGSGSWGAMRSTEQILTRFVEMEVDDNWPHNGHLTQVLWRSSKYVGCAEASKPYGESGTCHTQVCRYVRPGNCNMNKYKKSETDDWWLEPMLLEETSCEPACPPDGCY